MTNQDLESCKRDIEIIKSTIEKSKVNLESIAKLFLFYGIFSFIFTVLGVIINHFGSRDWYQTVHTIYIIVDTLTSMLLVFMYIRKYLTFKNEQNIYSLQLLRVWGIVMFYIPIFNCCFFWMYILLMKIMPNFYRPLLLFTSTFIEVIVFIMATVFTGIVLNKKALTTVALCTIPAILILFLFGAGYPSDISMSGIYNVLTYINRQTDVCQLIPLLGYIAMGIYLLPPKRRKHGT